MPDYAEALDGNVSGLKLGLPREYLKDLTSETGDLIWRAVDELKQLGCEVREISLPATEYAIACVLHDRTAEASSNLARYDGVRYTMRSCELGHAYRTCIAIPAAKASAPSANGASCWARTC